MSNVHTIIHASERPTYLSTTTHLRMRCAKSAISCLDKGVDPSNDMDGASVQNVDEDRCRLLGAGCNNYLSN